MSTLFLDKVNSYAKQKELCVVLYILLCHSFTQVFLLALEPLTVDMDKIGGHSKVLTSCCLRYKAGSIVLCDTVCCLE